MEPRITLTVTRYTPPTEDEVINAARGAMLGGRRGMEYDMPPSSPIKNVLVVDISEDQYAAIKKATLEAF